MRNVIILNSKLAKKIPNIFDFFKLDTKTSNLC